MLKAINHQPSTINHQPTVEFELARAIPVLRAAGVDNPRLEAELLIAHACGIERVAVVAHPERMLSKSERIKFHRMLARRARRYPLAYLLKKQEFWGMELEVSPAVLVPRPETETLVEAAVEFLKDLAEPTVADIGTGSGAIAVALAKELPGAKVFATDISAAALRVARRNAKRLIGRRRVRFLRGDMLSPVLELGLRGKLDAICANPPYVPSGELPGLQPEVALYEPRVATDGGKDGLAFQRAIASQSMLALRPGGRLFVEVAAGQSVEVGDLMTNAGLRVTSVRRDLQGIERVVIAERETTDRGTVASCQLLVSSR